MGQVANEEEGLFAGVPYEAEVDSKGLLHWIDVRSPRSKQGVVAGHDAEAESEAVGGEGGGEKQVATCVLGLAVRSVRVWLLRGRLDARCGYG